jgi:hypothetical protein
MNLLLGKKNEVVFLIPPLEWNLFWGGIIIINIDKTDSQAIKRGAYITITQTNEILVQRVCARSKLAAAEGEPASKAGPCRSHVHRRRVHEDSPELNLGESCGGRYRVLQSTVRA